MSKRLYLLTGILAGLIMNSATHSVSPECKKSTDLEIYTHRNIYYVKGLSVTEDNSDIKLSFKNKEELKEYIAHMTVCDINQKE